MNASNANPLIWAEVDLGAVAHNVRELRRCADPRAKVMAVVKADGYGHGAVEVAPDDQVSEILPDVDLADIHGQFQFNFQHSAITPERSKSLLDWAFRLDFERNGPSLFRLTRLDRVYFAGLTKKNLPRGKWRFLTDQEVSRLKMNAYE